MCIVRKDGYAHLTNNSISKNKKIHLRIIFIYSTYHLCLYLFILVCFVLQCDCKNYVAGPRSIDLGLTGYLPSTPLVWPIFT